jgi:hypothetical protein
MSEIPGDMAERDDSARGFIDAPAPANELDMAAGAAEARQALAEALNPEPEASRWTSSKKSSKS